MTYTESNYESAILQLFQDSLGYTYIYGPDAVCDYHSPLYEDVLLPSLRRINPNLPADAINEAVYKLKNFESGTLLQKNMVFMDYLQNGIVVMTQGNNDPEEWREVIGNKARKEDMARKFKDNGSPLKIAIVVDMWLTGFDVPSLATMYVYKPMSGHNLMQAIARVNRVFQDKEGGLVVDYVGIAAALKQAMNDYTSRDKKNYGDTDISKAAYPKFLEKLSVCRDFFHGFDYSKFIVGDDLEKAKAISGGVNFILGRSVAENGLPENERTQNLYMKEALLLRQALTLCGSLADEAARYEAAFFDAVRTMLVRLQSGGTGKKFTLPEVNGRINELLKHSIKSEGGNQSFLFFNTVLPSFGIVSPVFLFLLRFSIKKV